MFKKIFCTILFASLFFNFGCSSVQSFTSIPQHLRTGNIVDVHAVDHRHTEDNLGVRLLVQNNTSRDYRIIVACDFYSLASESVLSTNEVVLSIPAYMQTDTWVMSSRTTNWPTRVHCIVTDETQPIILND